MKIALVHDYLIQDGGAERVLMALHEIWPEAPIFALLHDPKHLGPSFNGKDIRTSFLQRLPFALRHYKWFMPLMPSATEHYNLDEYDVVISSTSAFAKGIITRPDALHICYCHTPTRYLWSDTHSYIESLRLPAPVRRLTQMSLSKIRLWDRLAADRVDRFIANSETVRHRIMKYYKRDSEVINPPVETSNFRVAKTKGAYFVAGGRLVAYKRFDLIIKAFNKLGLKLKIFGEGPEAGRLKAMARRNVEFTGKINDREKADLYRLATAYIHPQEEDFGITAVEAMACGRPVIAYRQGGATETVIEGLTGVFFDEQTPEAIASAVVNLKPDNFDPKKIREHAENYSKENFRRRIETFVTSAYEEWSGRIESSRSEARVREMMAG